MGCDIHLFAEKKVKPSLFKRLIGKKSKWVSIDRYTPNKDYPHWDKRPMIINREDNFYSDGRNYNLFCALAGVRSYMFEPEPTNYPKPKGLPKDTCSEIKEEADIYGSDGHTHSWLTLKELEELDLNEYGRTCDRFLNEVLPKLIKENAKPEDIRIVFFFDN